MLVSLILVALLAIAILVVASRRGARARHRQELADRLRAVLAELGLTALGEGFEQEVLDHAEADEQGIEALFRAVAEAHGQGFAPIRRKLDFKAEGQSILPRLVQTGAIEGLVGAAHRPVADSGISVIYQLEGEPGISYLTETALAESGIDEDAVWGVSQAVLRQRFEGDAVRRAVASGEAVELPNEDAFTASRLLQLHEHLEPGQDLFAVAPTPDRLVIAATRALLPAVEPGAELSGTVFRIGADGPDPLRA